MKKIVYFSLLLIPLLFLSACTNGNAGPRAELGNPDAPILIEEFSDIECPACATISPQIEEIVKKNPELARFRYYHFPLPQHDYAFPAAEATECAHDQGKYWEYLMLAFKNQRKLSEDKLKSMAAELGLDQQSFDECYDSGKKKSKVKADLYEGRRRQVSYTPSIFVNGQLIQWNGVVQFEAYLKSL